MASISSGIFRSNPNPLAAFTFRMRLVGLVPIRLRLASAVVVLAAWIAGRPIAFDLKLDEQLQFNSDGLPRALSLIDGYKGHSVYAAEHGANLLICLDGAELHDVVAYDIDRGFVVMYVRNEKQKFTLARMGELSFEEVMIQKYKGNVTVERKPA